MAGRRRTRLLYANANAVSWVLRDNEAIMVQSKGASIGNALQVICVIIVTAVIVRHEFFSPSVEPKVQTAKLSAEQWREATSAGHRMGPENAPVIIVEFADFECPACRAVTRSVLRPLQAVYANRLAVVFRHWPLSYHTHAYPAARAAECAALQGRFTEFHDLLYSHQDSLGRKSFSSFAKDAGVSDLNAFDHCNASTDTVTAIETDIREVTSLGGQGTPTILVNGMQLKSIPDSGSLDAMIRAALKQAKSK